MIYLTITLEPVDGKRQRMAELGGSAKAIGFAVHRYLPESIKKIIFDMPKIFGLRNSALFS